MAAQSSLNSVSWLAFRPTHFADICVYASNAYTWDHAYATITRNADKTYNVCVLWHNPRYEHETFPTLKDAYAYVRESIANHDFDAQYWD